MPEGRMFETPEKSLTVHAVAGCGLWSDGESIGGSTSEVMTHLQVPTELNFLKCLVKACTNKT